MLHLSCFLQRHTFHHHRPRNSFEKAYRTSLPIPLLFSSLIYSSWVPIDRYLLGSGGTLCFDITIVAQSFIYRPKPRRHHTAIRTIDEEEAGLLASADLGPHPPLSAGEAAIVNRGRPGRTRSLG